MSGKIVNLKRNRPVSLRLNSGRTVHIAPGATLEIEDVEVDNNAKVKKLEDRRVIARIKAKKEKQQSARPDKEEKTKSTKKK